MNNYTRLRRDVAREYVYQYLSTHPCEICGESDPIVLEFHHTTEDKTGDIAILVGRGHSLKKIQAEIDKCQVVSRNCHARITAEEPNFYRFKQGK